MITIDSEDDAKLYEAIGQMAARVCGLEHVELVSEFKKRLVEGIESFNERKRALPSNAGVDTDRPDSV